MFLGGSRHFASAESTALSYSPYSVFLVSDIKTSTHMDACTSEALIYKSRVLQQQLQRERLVSAFPIAVPALRQRSTCTKPAARGGRHARPAQNFQVFVSSVRIAVYFSTRQGWTSFPHQIGIEMVYAFPKCQRVDCPQALSHYRFSKRENSQETRLNLRSKQQGGSDPCIWCAMPTGVPARVNLPADSATCI